MKPEIVAVVLVVVVGGASACDAPAACTLVGCSSALTVDAPAMDAAPFTVLVESATLNGSVSCPAADVNGDRGAPIETSGDIVADGFVDGDVRATCDRRGVTLNVLRSDASDVLPPSAIITITSGENTFTADADPIVYDVSQPNGPDCEPTCSSATLIAG